MVRQARLFQVILAAHCPDVFKHLVAEGVAPELFYCTWLQALFRGRVSAIESLRIWDLFLFERSHKIFVRTAIAIFALLGDRLRRGDVEHMMKLLFDTQSWGFEPDAVILRALEIKVTRSMLREVETVDSPSIH